MTLIVDYLHVTCVAEHVPLVFPKVAVSILGDENPLDICTT